MKGLITITITVILLVLMLPAQATADTKVPLSYDRAVSLMKLNNSTLEKLQRAEKDAFESYQSSVLSAGNIDVNGFTATINGKETYITYGAEKRLSMIKSKELGPAQAKYSWESARDKRIVTENTLRTSLRGVFLKLFNTQNDLQLKQKQLSLTTEISKQNATKLKNGAITVLDMEETDYNLLKAQKDLDAASRDYDNAVRSFNQFAGLPAETAYIRIIYEEASTRPELKPVETYIDSALANRSDILNLQKQLALKELNKKLTETGYTYKTDTAEQNIYERLLNDIEHLNLDVEGMKLTITDEIKNAYVDIMSAGKGLDNMYNTVTLRRSNYEKMQTKYKSGVITKNVLTQNEISLLQTENRYKAMLFDYNSKVVRFNNATAIGPGY